jgi:ornithine decarboxylase
LSEEVESFISQKGMSHEHDDAIRHIISTDPLNIEPFYVMDLHDIAMKDALWRSELPRVDPFYAMKCNPNPIVLNAMLRLGTGFDCASRGEIETMIGLGVPPDRIIYANPCKPLSHIKYAASVGVHLMTFDNADELEKCKLANPQSKMVLRVLTDDSAAVCRLGLKFGAPPSTTMELLKHAKQIGIDIVGVSFHCGSGGGSGPSIFGDAVRRARKVFDEALSLGFQPNILDIGGGFPGARDSADHFKGIARVISAALAEEFPESTGVKIIGEPGRFYVCSSCTLATCIIARRVQRSATQQPEAFMYYINDGAYASFNCTLYDHYEPRAFPLLTPAHDARRYPTTLWGPTCDSMDCISKTQELGEQAVGDWLVWEDMGAYTMAAASSFNGFQPARIFTLDSLPPKVSTAAASS